MACYVNQWNQSLMGWFDMRSHLLVWVAWGWESDSVLGQVIALVTDHLLLAEYYLNMEGLQLNVRKDQILLHHHSVRNPKLEGVQLLICNFLLMEWDSYSLDGHCSIYNSPLCLATTTVRKSVSRLLPAINQDRVLASAAHPNLSALLTGPCMVSSCLAMSLPRFVFISLGVLSLPLFARLRSN